MAYARIDGIVARDVPVAVIFRRGPSKLTQLLVWNLETDEVTPGQWIKGRVYTRRCDLSPDGRLLVGAFTNYSTKPRHNQRVTKQPFSHDGWTAISRPPYFTAIALWFMGGAWNGGGIWRSPYALEVNSCKLCWEVSIQPPRSLRVRELGWCLAEDEPLYSLLLQSRGWQEVRTYEARLVNPKGSNEGGQPGQCSPRFDSLGDLEQWIAWVDSTIPKYEVAQTGLWVKRFAGGTLERTVGKGELWQIRNATGETVRQFKKPTFDTQFLDVDPRGRVIYGDMGCLWAWENCPDGEPTLIADLNGNSFENVPPPDWATRWP